MCSAGTSGIQWRLYQENVQNSRLCGSDTGGHGVMHGSCRARKGVVIFGAERLPQRWPVLLEWELRKLGVTLWSGLARRNSKVWIEATTSKPSRRTRNTLPNTPKLKNLKFKHSYAWACVFGQAYVLLLQLICQSFSPKAAISSAFFSHPPVPLPPL